MELRQLRYFIKIADLRSFSKASKALHIVQPALSQQVAALEAEVGHALFERLSTGVETTQLGEIFYAHAQRVLQQLDDMKAALSESAMRPVGTVRVGLPQSTALRFAMPLLALAGGKYPGIQLEFFDEISGRLLHGLRRGQLDLAVIVNDEDAALLDSVAVMDEMLLLVSSSKSAPPPGDVSLRDLAQMPLALPGEGHGVRSIVEEALRREGLHLPRPAVVANSINIMLRSIAEGHAHGVMPWGAVADLLESGALVARAISPSLTRRVHLSTCRDFHRTAAARAVFDEILAQTRAQVACGAWQAATLVEAGAHRP